MCERVTYWPRTGGGGIDQLPSPAQAFVNTPLPSEQRDILGRNRTVYGLEWTYLQERTRSRFHKRSVPGEIRSRVLDNVKKMWRRYVLSYRGKRSTHYPAQGKPYITQVKARSRTGDSNEKPRYAQKTCIPLCLPHHIWF